MVDFNAEIFDTNMGSFGGIHKFRSLSGLHVTKILKIQRQKQPSIGVLIKSFMEIALRHGSSPLNLLLIFRTSFLKDTYGGLFLKLASI